MADGVYEINEIIGRRVTLFGKEEYLVHWKKYKARESTWEPLENLRSCLGNITEFLHKAYPLPGLHTSEILHLKPKTAAVPLQAKLKKITQVNKKKLRAGHHKEILNEIMRQKAKELEIEKEQVITKRRSRKRETDVARYVLRSEETIFNGQTLDLSCATSTSPGAKRKRKRGSVAENHTIRPLSPRKSKDHALLAMASANMKINNNFDWLSIDSPAADRSIRTTRTHGELQQSVMVSREGSVMKLTLCNEERQNALTIEMCEQLVAALHEAAKDDVNVVVITGAGKHFCSGLDYSCVTTTQKGAHYKQSAKLLVEKFKLLVEVIINLSKPLVAAVNGSAMAFGTSLVALCDVAYITEKATLETCFTKWGHTPIGCCTYTLPQILGQAAACSLLLYSGHLTADDAVENGLVVEKFGAEEFQDEVMERLKILAALSTKCIQDTKSLLFQGTQQTLKDTNTEECKMLLKYLLDDKGIATLAKIWKKDIMG